MVGLGLALGLALAGCSPSAPLPAPDAGTWAELDAGFDAGPGDGGPSDSGIADAGAGVPRPGFGAISGECGVLDVELTDLSPHYFENHLDFGNDSYDPGDFSRLTDGGKKIASTPNAGGSSVLSEAFAYELLERCELARLLKTEAEVLYSNPAGKLTDILVEIDALKIGVSVTRAVTYPRSAPYTEAQAKALLETKLKGILDSSANVTSADRWTKQILLVVAYGPQHADSLGAAYQTVSANLKADTVVMVTVSDGDDEFLY